MHCSRNFSLLRSLLSLFCSCKSSCRLHKYKRAFLVFSYAHALHLLCFRVVLASFTLTTMAVGNTSEGFASVLSPWSICSGVRSTPFRVVSVSEVSPIQLGVWGGRCKPPSGVWGSAPEAFENYAFFFPSFDHFHIKSLNVQLGLNCGVFQGQGFVDHKTRCQSASSRPLLAVLQYGVHLVDNVWLFRLSKRQKDIRFAIVSLWIRCSSCLQAVGMHKCSCVENKRTKPR